MPAALLFTNVPRGFALDRLQEKLLARVRAKGSGWVRARELKPLCHTNCLIRCATQRPTLACPLAAPTKCHSSAGAAATTSSVADARSTRSRTRVCRKTSTAASFHSRCECTQSSGLPRGRRPFSSLSRATSPGNRPGGRKPRAARKRWPRMTGAAAAAAGAAPTEGQYRAMSPGAALGRRQGKRKAGASGAASACGRQSSNLHTSVSTAGTCSSGLAYSCRSATTTSSRLTTPRTTSAGRLPSSRMNRPGQGAGSPAGRLSSRRPPPASSLGRASAAVGRRTSCGGLPPLAALGATDLWRGLEAGGPPSSPSRAFGPSPPAARSSAAPTSSERPPPPPHSVSRAPSACCSPQRLANSRAAAVRCPTHCPARAGAARTRQGRCLPCAELLRPIAYRVARRPATESRWGARSALVDTATSSSSSRGAAGSLHTDRWARQTRGRA
eukprot:scaffold35023_cov71-Phaeocystis_antarctica.AAC.6